MLIRKFFLFLSCALALNLAVQPAQAKTAKKQSVTDIPLIFNEEHTSLFGDSAVAQGYDVVSYFDGKPQPGKETIQTEYRDGNFWFSSIENQKRFLENPAKYIPAYGGYCAYSVAQGYLAPIDPKVYKIYKGKLYLNYNEAVQARWLKDIDGFIKKANVEWPKIKNKGMEYQESALPDGIILY